MEHSVSEKILIFLLDKESVNVNDIITELNLPKKVVFNFLGYLWKDEYICMLEGEIWISEKGKKSLGYYDKNIPLATNHLREEHRPIKTQINQSESILPLRLSKSKFLKQIKYAIKIAWKYLLKLFIAVWKYLVALSLVYLGISDHFSEFVKWIKHFFK